MNGAIKITMRYLRSDDKGIHCGAYPDNLLTQRPPDRLTIGSPSSVLVFLQFLWPPTLSTPADLDKDLVYLVR